MELLQDDLEITLRSVRIATPEDIRPAAIALRDYAWRCDRLRVATCHNIASKTSMTDGEGNILATSVFGWTERPLVANSRARPALACACPGARPAHASVHHGIRPRARGSDPSSVDVAAEQARSRVPEVQRRTDIEISLILKLSRATVRFHLRNASEKLDAVNKSQVLFKAAQLGYIAF
jgi:hypothetical protein